MWRVEVRAGKRELQRWNIRTFSDVEAASGDVIRTALDEIRYVAPSQGDSNVTRQRLDPLWETMIAQVEQGLFAFRAGLSPSRIKEIERETAISTYAALVLGNLAGLSVAKGLQDPDINSGALHALFEELFAKAMTDRDGKFHRTVARARERLHFITAG